MSKEDGKKVSQESFLSYKNITHQESEKIVSSQFKKKKKSSVFETVDLGAFSELVDNQLVIIKGLYLAGSDFPKLAATEDWRQYQQAF